MWTKASDGSIIDSNGRVIFFSNERFRRDICLGDCCFICGAKPDDKEFNNEHILPKWLLRRYQLFDKTIVLPNDGAVRYGGYTVPCCEDCNSLMGTEVEDTISGVVQGGSSSVNDFLVNGHLLKIFVWMGLIFLKTHLKDRKLHVHLDRRKGTKKIGDQYDWSTLHHIHSLARCFYNGCYVEREAIGSFLSIPVKTQGTQDRFDFVDLHHAQTMMLRLDDIGMIAVFNDSSGVMAQLRILLDKITPPVHELQLRELLAEMAYLNLHVKNRPAFYTECDRISETCRIGGMRPTLEFESFDKKVRGALLHRAVREALPHIRVRGKTADEIDAAIKSGSFSFLFDDEGKFIQGGWEPE